MYVQYKQMNGLARHIVFFTCDQFTKILLPQTMASAKTQFASLDIPTEYVCTVHLLDQKNFFLITHTLKLLLYKYSTTAEKPDCCSIHVTGCFYHCAVFFLFLSSFLDKVLPFGFETAARTAPLPFPRCVLLHKVLYSMVGRNRYVPLNFSNFHITFSPTNPPTHQYQMIKISFRKSIIVPHTQLR